MKRYLVERELIQNNIQVLQKKAGSAVIWAVLKGNGYGLGLLPMAETCRAAGLDHFAVTEIAEARALREGGFETEPILMLQPTADADEITALLPLHVIFTISSTEDASVLAGLAAQAGVTAEAHIKIDTGMGRYGFLPEEMEKITPVYHYMDTIHVTGIYTHLHSAFCDKKATKAQIESFNRVLAALREAGIEPGMAHILNSSGVPQEDHLNFLRDFLFWPAFCDEILEFHAGAAANGAGSAHPALGFPRAARAVVFHFPVDELRHRCLQKQAKM